MTIRTLEMAGILVEGITDGKPLRQLCREHGISKSAVYRWIDEDPDLAGRIAHARARGYDQLAEEALEIADDRTDDPASRRVRVETRLKLLAKWDSSRYGDKLTVDSNATVTHKYDLDSLSSDKLDQLEAILTDAQRNQGGAGTTVAPSVH